VFLKISIRPSIDPVLMIRMLIIGYVFAIRSERQICREVRVNLAYRWFCNLGLEDAIPDHSAFSRARNERFRESNRQRSIPGVEWKKQIDPQAASRAVKEYLATLNDAAFGAATEVQPKFVSPSDPAAQWTGALKGPAFFAYADNYLIDVKHGVIVDVEASRAIRQAEVGAARTMIERTEKRFGLKPQRLAGDTAYGAAPMLNWLVEEKQITPHIPVLDKSKRDDGTFSRGDFRYDDVADAYTCPAGKTLSTSGTVVNDGATLLYLASTRDYTPCPLKARCCPKTSFRRVPLSIYERARDVARPCLWT
jgi:IS5 family transposase